MKSIQKLQFAKQFCPTLLLFAVALPPTLAAEVAVPSPVDPAATQILKRMTDYVGGLTQFSVYTQNTLENLTAAGRRVDEEVSARVIVHRPNQLLAERRGDVIAQNFYFDGKVLTLGNPSDKVYATVPAPATIDGALHYAREKLGLIIPASDLVYSNSFPLLMAQVNYATVVDKAFIDGVRCDHLLFSRPGVDFQVWVADKGSPLPLKFVVTDTTTLARLSVSTVMSQWNLTPDVAASRFTFTPGAGDKLINFLPLPATSAANR